MTKIGMDVKLQGGLSAWGDGPQSLHATKDAGLDGLRIRTLDELSPTLDLVELADFAALADDLGLYVEMGVGKVNPYMTAELPRVRDLGDGSYLAGMERMFETCARFGWTEMWSAVGGFKPYPDGLFFTDRFRSDTDWDDQLRATEKFLRRLAPALRANGVRLNLETHEEITTFELLRLIDVIGDDVLGLCLDPANLIVRAEVPLEGIARVAPYVRSTQLRDAAICRVPVGLTRLLAPCGEGVIDWTAALDILMTAQPDLRLTIEGIGGVRAEMRLDTSDPTWLAGHPDLTPEALDELYRLADDYEARAALGEVDTLDQLRAPRKDLEALESFTLACAAHLRDRLAAREPVAAR